MITITCPVCDRPEIEGDICPNCETDLSSVRMLIELPKVNSGAANAIAIAQPQRFSIVVWLSLALLLLAIGMGLGVAAYSLSLSSRQEQLIGQTQPTPSVISATTPTTPTIPLKQNDCNGFIYTVRGGDSLARISSRFYGNEIQLSAIEQANPKLQNRERSLQIGENLCVPNLGEKADGTF